MPERGVRSKLLRSALCLPLLLAGLWASSFALGNRKVDPPQGLPAEPVSPHP